MRPVAEKLPEFWTLSKKVAANLHTKKLADWATLVPEICPLLDADLVTGMDEIIPGWKEIATLQGGETALHTLLVFTICLSLPEYMQADAQTCREIEWAAVLHDLDKKQSRNDPAHPFRSAAVAAGLLPALGFELQPNIAATDLAAWSNLVLSAQRPADEQMIHDHTALPAIISGLHQSWGADSSAARVLKAVLLHQSLPALKAWPSPALLTDEELASALTLKDMDVLGALMLADSDSWNIFDETRLAYGVEIRARHAETRQRIQHLRSPL